MKCTSGKHQNKDLLTVQGSRPNSDTLQCVYRQQKNHNEWFKVREVVFRPATHGDFVVMIGGRVGDGRELMHGKALRLPADCRSPDFLLVQLETGRRCSLAVRDLVPVQRK